MDKAKSPRKVSPWVAGVASLSLVGVAFAGGTLASFKLGDQQALDIAAKHHIATTSAELYPPYKGDPSQNAFEIVDHLASAKQRPHSHTGSLDGTFDLARAKAALLNDDVALALSEKLADRPNYAPKHQGNLVTMQFPEYEQLKRAAILLGARGRIRAVEGDLDGAVGDFERVVRIANFMDREPSLIGGLVNASLANRLLRTITETSPAFTGHPQAFARLQAIPGALHAVDFARGVEGEASMAVSIATHQWGPATLGSTNENEGSPSSPYLEATRAIWGPAIVQGWADDLEEVRKAPTDPNNPGLAFPNLQKIARAGGPAGQTAQLLTPAGSNFRKSLTSPAVYKQLAALTMVALQHRTRPDIFMTQDPFGSGPYKLRTSKDGWILYSVGNDGSDDGGVVKADGTSHDIVVRLSGNIVTMSGH